MLIKKRSPVTRKAYIFVILALLFLMAACGTPSSSMPISTPAPDLRPLLSTAKPLCETAFSAPLSSHKVLPKSFVGSTFTLISSAAPEQEAWTWDNRDTLPGIEALSPAKVQTFVCIKQSFTNVGTYTVGGSAFERDWDVRLVRRSDGSVFNGMRFSSAPPSTITTTRGAGEGYGIPPIADFFPWLIDALGDRTVLFSPDMFTAMAFSPDRKILATGTGDQLATGAVGQVKLWNVTTRQVLRTLPGNKYDVESIAFSPDGKTLATGIYDHVKLWDEVKLWDVATGRVEHTFVNESSTSTSRSITFSPNGKTLASVVLDKVKLWDVITGRVEHTFVNEQDVSSIAFSPQSNLLATGGQDNVKIWNVMAGQVERTIKASAIEDVGFSPDGKSLAGYELVGQNSVSGEGDVKLWDVATGQEIHTFGRNGLFVASMALPLDGKTLATGETDGSVTLWDVATGQVLRTFNGQGGRIDQISFSPDGNILATLANYKFLNDQYGHSNGTIGVPSEQYGVIRLLDVGTGQ